MTSSDDLPEINNQEFGKYTMSVTVMITGVAAHRIRRFEEYGLCKPCRTSSQQRLFSDCDVKLIQEIAVLEQDGINLVGIKTILNMKKTFNESKSRKK
jgi:DNA-binding transcriptional MerR regulator